ncbi:MAG: 4Fe-4S dicluster domain-containing protein [Bryobacterales bacterium]|nr:4Fe-4S dicluster domain-containing protein [Bryobacterales bacterium]
MSYAILFDSTKCIGCRSCESACAEKWGNPYNEQIGAQEKLSARKLTTIQTKGEKFMRKLCMHCLEPACASACPVSALYKTAEGPVEYDADKCIGCRYCMTACAFVVPSYEWDKRLPKVKKCNMCRERQLAGKPTACTEACPTEATITGDRDKMIAEARKRVAENPGQYYPKVFGVEEVGGTSVIMLAAVPFEQLGLPANLPKEALPAFTWRALSLVPSIATVGSVLLGGVYWITHRREEVMRAEGRKR